MGDKTNDMRARIKAMMEKAPNITNAEMAMFQREQSGENKKFIIMNSDSPFFAIMSIQQF